MQTKAPKSLSKIAGIRAAEKDIERFGGDSEVLEEVADDANIDAYQSYATYNDVRREAFYAAYEMRIREHLEEIS